MTLKFNGRAKGGFSLLELTVVLIITAILVSAVIPQLINGYLVKAANKTALDISAIEEASRAYYIANNKWPDNSVYSTPIAALQVGNYLPSSWNAINPFGYSSATPSTYSYNVSSNPSLLTVNTFVPITAQPTIQNLLPATSISGNVLYSSVPVPGGSSVLPTGTILPWASNNLPAGFFWCNGSPVSRTTYSGLYAVIGTIYGAGDGGTTFNLPDLMDRTITGQDGMGGVSATNRITMWGASPATIGGTFGEDKHHLTVPELPAHNFYIMINDTTSSGGPVRYPETVAVTNLKPYYTNTVGEDQSHNVVQPSITMGYIIKY